MILFNLQETAIIDTEYFWLLLQVNKQFDSPNSDKKVTFDVNKSKEYRCVSNLVVKYSNL